MNNNTTIEALKQQQEASYIDNNNERTKREAEFKQDEVYSGLSDTQGAKLRSIMEQSYKIEAVKKSLQVEEVNRKQIEQERDDNLVAYLEERARRLDAEAQNRMLRQQVREADLSRIQQIEYNRRQRDDEFTQDQQTKKLNEASRSNFQKLLDSQKGFKFARK